MSNKDLYEVTIFIFYYKIFQAVATRLLIAVINELIGKMVYKRAFFFI